MTDHVAGESDKWYVAGYYPRLSGRTQSGASDPADHAFMAYHPFSANFMLAPWDIKDSKIDSYERVPYKRVNVVVSPVV
jgi:hypothetical protein